MTIIVGARFQRREMKTSDFDYDLPPELIAQTPAEPRDHSRLMVLNREAYSWQHRRFHDIVDYLEAGDLVIANDSRVIPARLFGRKADTGGKVELLLLHRTGDGLWECLVKPGRRLSPGVVIELDGGESRVRAEVVDRTQSGSRLIHFSDESSLDQLGDMPLPPYIHAELADPERYQTIYAKSRGSAAAPTAGLHFTPDLMTRLGDEGIEFGFLTLHIGLATFRPVAVEDPTEHPMHAEYAELSPELASTIDCAKREGRRIVAVGTTAVRSLEEATQRAKSQSAEAAVVPINDWIDTFILPGYNFQLVDAMITNFHLPRSSLLMLVSAFAGTELIREAYAEAIDRRYRFYSFGDAMLIT
jgi:S-adenosylmethionine:tRNA ribosyltransferase-isomerase